MKMNIAIVGNGPKSHLPHLPSYNHLIDCWIGADRGALHIVEQGMTVDLALGDFDSVTTAEKERIKMNTKQFHTYPAEKNETDLELAVNEALKRQANELYFFGVSGARLDHGLINIQLLYPLLKQKVPAMIIDGWNMITLKAAGKYTINRHESFPYVSFVPFSEKVTGITLGEGFKYHLRNETITWGSTLCISNELSQQQATYEFTSGYVLVIQSKDR